jgi:hypothetical protein
MLLDLLFVFCSQGVCARNKENQAGMLMKKKVMEVEHAGGDGNVDNWRVCSWHRLEVVLVAQIGGCARFGTDWRLCSWQRMEAVLVLAQIGGCARFGTDWRLCSWHRLVEASLHRYNIDCINLASFRHRFGIEFGIDLLCWVCMPHT